MLSQFKPSALIGSLKQFSLINNCSRYVSLKVGDVASVRKTVTAEDVKKFAELTGDTNPLHLDQEFVKGQTTFKDCLVHGAYLNSLVSHVIGTRLPGPGTLVAKEELHFPNPCYVGESVEVTVKLMSLRKVITVDFWCISSEGKVVLQGHARLLSAKTLTRNT